jgi:putative N-acetylmannosamine-6-phosphate epimerase
MATPNSSFSDIITTSLQGYSGQIADNITNHNALLRQIDRKGNKMVSTGRTIVQEIDFAENGTVAYYSGAETLDTTQGEVLTAAEFNYKQLAKVLALH